MTVEQIAGYRRDVLPLHIEPIQAEALAATQVSFQSRWPSPFLIYTRSTLWDRTLLFPADFGGGNETKVARYDLYEGGLTFLQPVRKMQTDPGHPGVILGRAKTQDMVVPVPSISSAHAAFIPPQPPTMAWTVMDLGSRNGTWLNETQLPLRQPRPINSGEYLRLGGNLIAWFFLPAKLWEVLRKPEELKRFTEI